MIRTRLNDILGIRYPVIQGGMAWITGWEMASVVSEAGGLGTIASATMEPAELVEQIHRVRKATDYPFAINIPLRLASAKKAVEIAIAERVPVIISSAGDPMPYTEKFKKKNMKVFQVVFSIDMVKRCHEAGVDGVIAMGVEGGGNLSPAELSTLILVREVAEQTDLPVVAAGGIADARGFVAALCLGAEGVQMGTRFLATQEATVHDNYKQAIVNAKDTDTTVTGRTTGLQFRVLKNELARKILEMEKEGREIKEIDDYTIGSLKKAAISGDMKWGSVMMGQVAGHIRGLKSARNMLDQLMENAEDEIRNLNRFIRPS